MTTRQNSAYMSTAPSFGNFQRSDHLPPDLRHSGAASHHFPSSPPTTSRPTPASSSSGIPRPSEHSDYQWTASPTEHAVQRPTTDFLKHAAENFAMETLRPVSPMHTLSRLSICSPSTNSSAGSSISGNCRSYMYSSPESSASPTPVAKKTASMAMTDMVEPKVEPVDEEDELLNVPPLPLPAPLEHETTAKRGRGRPRKHPVEAMKTVTKLTKGRSKTGCITCRRRKKKCDEAKPECNNCRKNSVYCEGYPEKSVWQPGRKHEGARAESLPLTRPLPTLIEGVETPADQMLLKHFNANISGVLTLHREKNNNPFTYYFLPMAMGDPALMHSLLALSSSHLAKRHPDKTEEFERAQVLHSSKAMNLLGEELKAESWKPEDKHVAVTLVFCLDDICRGNFNGEYEHHLRAARFMLKNSNEDTPESPRLRQFLYEFFRYHDGIRAITIGGDEDDVERTKSIDHEEWCPVDMDPSMLGVTDGLFGFMCRVNSLRRFIRTKRKTGEYFLFNEVLTEAFKLDDEIRDWVSPHVEGSDLYIASQLYRICAWIFLYRTINIADDPKIRASVNQGLEYLQLLPEGSGTQSNLLMPLFMLGCAAFDQEARPILAKRFESLYNWSGLGNVSVALRVVEKVWDLMDKGEWERTWDWEKLLKDMGYNFLIT